MSWLDIALIIIAGFGAYKGYREGFLMELFSLLGIVLGILGAFKLMGLALVVISDWFDFDRQVLPYIAFALVFLLIVIIVNLIGKMLRASIDKSFLGRVDEAAGGLLGLIKTVFLLSVVLWIVDSLNISIPERWTEDSEIAPVVASVAPLITSWVSEIIPSFSNIFR